jgi:excisionase family DNA binding protein
MLYRQKVWRFLPLEGVARFRGVPEDNVVSNNVALKYADETPLFRTDRVATLLHWHPGSVRRAIRQGRIRAVRVGQQWRVSGEELARVQAQGLR